jgi:hypothetical protein
VTALGPHGTEHLVVGGLTAAVAVGASLVLPSTRRWWPTIAAAVVVAAAVVEGTSRFLPAKGLLALAAIAVAGGAALGAVRVTEAGGSIGRCRRTGPALVALAAGGVVAGVPDTEVALRVLAATAVLAAVGFVVRDTPPRAWIAPWVAVVWAASSGAAGRPAAFAGTVACLGVVLSAPAALLVSDRRRLLAVPAVLVLSIQAAGALAAGRGPGLEEAVGPAVAGAAGILAIEVVVLALAMPAGAAVRRRVVRA